MIGEEESSLVEEASHATACVLRSQLGRCGVDLRQGFKNGRPTRNDGVASACFVPVAAVLYVVSNSFLARTS